MERAKLEDDDYKLLSTLEKKFDDVTKTFRDHGWYYGSYYTSGPGRILKCYKWLQKENISYVWVKNAHPSFYGDDDELFFKNENDLKLYELIFEVKSLTDETTHFLVNVVGWKALAYTDEITVLRKWLDESLEGAYVMDKQVIYFQHEEDAVLYRITHE